MINKIKIVRVCLESAKRNGKNAFPAHLYGKTSTISAGVKAQLKKGYHKYLGSMGFVEEEDFKTGNWAPYGLTEVMNNNPVQKSVALEAQNTELQSRVMELEKEVALSKKGGDKDPEKKEKANDKTK